MPNENGQYDELPDELVNELRDLVRRFEKEDEWVRQRQLKNWKKYDEFWHGVQYIFWSETRQDWLSPVDASYIENEESREGMEGPFYDYVINFYRAHGESVIAALSTQLPTVRFPPDDADSEEDIVTSRTFGKIADLIQKHNNSKISFLGALGIAWNQGLICAYHAPQEDKAFGKTQIQKTADGYICPTCEFSSKEEIDSCPNCNAPMEQGTIRDGYEEVNKKRVIWEIYGPRFVKVPFFAKTQKDFEYLCLFKDLPISLLKSMYPEIEDKIESFEDQGEYERIARSPSSYSSYNRAEDNRNNRTLKRVWFRPWALYSISKDKKEIRDKLLKMFPDGGFVAFVGDNFAEARNEDLDKYWTVEKVGISEYIHSDPLGQPLISPQEMSNTLTNLTIETIEQSIPDTFADSETLNFEVYSRHEARPGNKYPAKRRPNERLADSFYEAKGASLSKEVPAFAAWLEKTQQFVVGSFPSIFGGPTQASSRTAAEYDMSRQMAMQRLSIAWTFLSFWWARLLDKSVRLFVENLQQDEKYTTKVNNNYQTVWIRQAELTGEVGEVEPEASDSFPMSTVQKQSLLMRLIELNNPFINEAIFYPPNRTILADTMGFPDLQIPGSDQSIKQEREIQYMIKSGVVLPIDPEIDDDNIHTSVLASFMVGDVGWDLKMTNPPAYEVLMQHFMMHQQNMQMKAVENGPDSNDNQPVQQ